MRLIINIKDNSKASHLIKFLKDIPFIEIEESRKKESLKNIMDLYGIWENSDISIDTIRAKAWGR
ncbi:MAG: hypothetical protein JW881_08590 [Spirochaetales bacterium]|nr:hypothetical protein [Spirochaetales bacterium]